MRTHTILEACIETCYRIGGVFASDADAGKTLRQSMKFRNELIRRANDYDRLRETMPSVSIPSCWPADIPPEEPGVLTTTANAGTSVVWIWEGRK